MLDQVYGVCRGSGRFRKRLTTSLLVLAIAALASAAAVAPCRADGAAHLALPHGALALIPAAGTALPDFVRLVRSVAPAVVSITSRLATGQGDESPAQSSANGRATGGTNPAPAAVESKGSGFLVDANGTIVTNNHVVAGATSITVTLSDGTDLPATLIGHDRRTDLAVLRVTTGRKLNYIVLGNSAEVQPGEWVIAVGNPFGLGGTVTAGSSRRPAAA